MRQQPGVLASLAARREELTGTLRGVLPDPLYGMVLVARGSSDHAAIYGRYLLEPACRRPVGLGAPSLQTLYHAPVDYSGFLVIAVSQSGATPEIATVVERVRASGGRALAVTNDAGSPLARAADATVELRAGEERAVPATKTFTAQALAFALLASAWARAGSDPVTSRAGPGRPGDGVRPLNGPPDPVTSRAGPGRAGDGVRPLNRPPDGWDLLPPALEQILDDPGPAERTAEAIGGAPALIAMGRGACFPMALEVALKLKEAALLPAEGYSAADLRHGPKSIVSAGFPVLALRAGGPGGEDVEDLVATLRADGASVHEIAPGAELSVPDGLPEPLGALAAAVRGQQVALALARRRGLDPDAPPGLSKVTPTR